jgi:hypothetical protein
LENFEDEAIALLARVQLDPPPQCES